MLRLFRALLALAVLLLAHAWIAATAQAQCDNHAYIANANNGTVSVIDTVTGTVIDTITVGTFPAAIAISPNRRTVYVGNNTTNNISVIDTITNTVRTTIPAITVPRGLTLLPDASELWVTNNSVNTVTVIDTETLQTITTVPVGSSPSQIATHPDGSTVYVANQIDGTVSELDVASRSVTDTVAVGSNPLGMKVLPDGSEVWVANAIDNTVSVIDTATFAVTNTIAVGTQPSDVALAPDGSTAYVVNFAVDTVSVIDVATETVTGTINLGGGGLDDPLSAAVHPDGTRLYVCNTTPGVVDVVDTSTLLVVDTITVGPGPQSFGNFIIPNGQFTPLQQVYLDFGEIGVPVDKLDKDVLKEDGSVLMTLEKGPREGFDPADIGFVGGDRDELILQIVDQVLADFTTESGLALDICFDTRQPSTGDVTVVRIGEGAAPQARIAGSDTVLDVDQNRLVLDGGTAIGYRIGIEDGQLRRPDNSPVPGVTFPEYRKVDVDALGAAKTLDKGNTQAAGEAWVFVGAHNILPDPNANLRELGNTISHELAHLLGIEHSDGGATNIMGALGSAFGLDRSFGELTKRKLAEALPPFRGTEGAGLAGGGFLGTASRLRTAKIGDTDQHGTSETGPLGGTLDEDAESIFREARVLLQPHADAALEPYQFELADITQSQPGDGLYTDIPIFNGTTASYSLDLVDPGLTGTYVGARIELSLLNVADVLGGASDFKVYVDGFELEGALDGLDQRISDPDFAGYANGQRVTLYLDEFLTLSQIATILVDGILDVDLEVNGATPFISVDSVIALVTDDGPRAMAQCGIGQVNLAAGDRTDVLFVNGTAGGELRTVPVGGGEQIWMALLKPPAGGGGRFVMHMNVGEPTSANVTQLPANIGTTCFPVLLPGATPTSVWNNIGQTGLVGSSNFFGSPIPDPANAPTVFLQLLNGDATNLPVGTMVTLQGVIIDPQALSPRGVSATNAVLLSVE